MTSSQCTITFDNNPYGVYYAGQTVSGVAELVTNRPKTIRSIYITVSGYAEVRWTEDVNKQDNEGKPVKAIETFSSSEMYYSSEKYVYGQNGGPQLELPAGKYMFPFQATIPPNSPTSFNGAWGQIQHEVSVVIDRVMRYNNVFKQPFSLVAPFDLNLNPENARPLHMIEEKTFCWSMCCGNKQPMVMKVDVPFSAYAPGQKLRFKIELDNQSDMNCNDVKVRLMKKVIYTSRNPETKIKETLIKVADNHCGEVLKLNKADFNEFLQIPSTVPTSMSSCSIISISYSLKFIAKVRIHGDLVIEFPFTIGSVPLYASANDEAGAAAAVTTQPGVPAYKPLPPPMFEEDVRSEQFDTNTFKPRYPVFLSDAAANGSNGVPAPSGGSMYPSAAVLPTPLPPNPVLKPAVSPMPSPKVQPHMPMPMPSPQPQGPIASPASSHVNTQNTKKAEAVDNNIEVLGFSIPPDYQPTPSAPPAAGGNVGWNH